MANGTPEIQYYEHELNIKRVIEQSNLQGLDQALIICDLSPLAETSSKDKTPLCRQVQ